MKRTANLPDEFPIGTRYVVEGKNNAKGVLRVSARFVVFPDGRRVDLPLEAVTAPSISPRAVEPGRRRAKPVGRTARERARVHA